MPRLCSITEISIEVKKAIQEIRNFIYRGSKLEAKNLAATTIKVKDSMTEEQEKVLQLRSEKNYSFAAIATELNLSQKEVHKIFIAAYKFLEEKHQEQLQSA